MADTPGFGCGIYPVLLKKTRYAKACDWHDTAYLENSWHQQNMTRKQIDNWFKEQMTHIDGGKLRWTGRFFHFVASTFGGFWWENGKSR